MKAQSPDSRFRKKLNYSLTAFFDCQTPNSDPTMKTPGQSSEGDWGLISPRRTGRLSPDSPG